MNYRNLLSKTALVVAAALYFVVPPRPVSAQEAEPPAATAAEMPALGLPGLDTFIHAVIENLWSLLGRKETTTV